MNTAKAATGQTFYVDVERGDDDATGTSPEAAWKTLDKVNTATLNPGDRVLFRRGLAWRGTLTPRNGAPGAPMTYGAWGAGPKPALLGSVAKDSPADWEHVTGNIWRTKPPEYTDGGLVADIVGDLRWGLYREGGAQATLKRAEKDLESGVPIYRIDCDVSGKYGNHIQLSVAPFPVVQGQLYEFRFQAWSTKPFRIPSINLMKSGRPWNRYASPLVVPRVTVDSSPREYVIRYRTEVTADDGRITLFLGDVLPAGATFFFAPGSLRRVTCRGDFRNLLVVDVGCVVFDRGKVTGVKKWSADDLIAPYDFWYDPMTWSMSLYSEDNPAKQHRSIELALRRHIVNQSNRHHIVYENLAVRYGAAHGFGGGNTHHIVIRDCDVSYIGGGLQMMRPGGRPVRYGNGIEFWGAAHDNLVEGCRIWEIYDAALTNQGSSPSSHQVNITYRNNTIWNAEYSFEYWNRPESAITRNIRFEHNTCVNAGFGWAHGQRPDRNGSHLMFYRNQAGTSAVTVRGNIFCNASDWGMRMENDWRAGIDLDWNLWYEEREDGVLARYLGRRIPAAEFATYRRATGFDTHSVFANPRFVAPAKHDYRLAPDSPARTLGPDGTPAGASPRSGQAPSIR